MDKQQIVSVVDDDEGIREGLSLLLETVGQPCQARWGNGRPGCHGRHRHHLRSRLPPRRRRALRRGRDPPGRLCGHVLGGEELESWGLTLLTRRHEVGGKNKLAVDRVDLGYSWRVQLEEKNTQ